MLGLDVTVPREPDKRAPLRSLGNRLIGDLEECKWRTFSTKDTGLLKVD